jgi:hypothetical protein
MIWGFSYRLAMQGVTDLAALMAIGITVLHSFQITADSAHAKYSGRPCWGLLLARIATIYYRRTNANSIRHKIVLTSQIEMDTR